MVKLPSNTIASSLLKSVSAIARWVSFIVTSLSSLVSDVSTFSPLNLIAAFKIALSSFVILLGAAINL